jgi:hypothetical protein
MTRICSACKTELGEKCGVCGSEKLEVIYSAPAYGIRRYYCTECQNKWWKGDDCPPTHGICVACFTQQVGHPPALEAA